MALTFSFCLSGFVCDCQWLRFFFSPPFFPMDERLEATRPLSLSPPKSAFKAVFCVGLSKNQNKPLVVIFFCCCWFLLAENRIGHEGFAES